MQRPKFFPSYTPDEMLGPLNSIEEKHVAKQFYTSGDLSILNGPRVAIVGTRQPTPSGAKIAEELASYCAEREIVVVSGLATGIDTIAHTSAIDSGGKTIAVLGTPLDTFYPKENARLQELIMRDHLVISQFHPGSPVQKRNFPLRNRTMALVAHTTIVVEAGAKSGTISQGWETLV